MSKLPYVWWCNLLTEVNCQWRPVDFEARAFVRGLKREDFNGFIMVVRDGRRRRYDKTNIEGLVVDILPRIGAKLREDIGAPISLVPIPNSGMAVGVDGDFRTVQLANLVAQGFGAGCTVVPALRWDAPREQAHKNHEHRSPDLYEPHLQVVEAPQSPVVLFDDVLTSGSQMIAAARVLKKAGFAPTRSLVIATATKAQLEGRLFAKRVGQLELNSSPFNLDDL